MPKTDSSTTLPTSSDVGIVINVLVERDDVLPFVNDVCRRLAAYLNSFDCNDHVDIGNIILDKDECPVNALFKISALADDIRLIFDRAADSMTDRSNLCEPGAQSSCCRCEVTPYDD